MRQWKTREQGSQTKSHTRGQNKNEEPIDRLQDSETNAKPY